MNPSNPPPNTVSRVAAVSGPAAGASRNPDSFVEAYIRKLKQLHPTKNEQEFSKLKQALSHTIILRMKKAVQDAGLPADDDSLITLLLQLATGPLASKSPYGIAKPGDISAALLGRLRGPLPGNAQRDSRPSDKKSSGSEFKPSRPSSASDYLKPAEADDLAERQRSYDFVFNCVAAQYALPLTRMAKFLWAFSDEFTNTRISQFRLNAWHTLSADKDVMVKRYWMAFVALFNFDYPSLFSAPTLDDEILSPTWCESLEGCEAVAAICGSLLALAGNDKKAHVVTCVLKTLIVVANDKGHSLRAAFNKAIVNNDIVKTAQARDNLVAALLRNAGLPCETAHANYTKITAGVGCQRISLAAVETMESPFSHLTAIYNGYNGQQAIAQQLTGSAKAGHINYNDAGQSDLLMTMINQ